MMTSVLASSEGGGHFAEFTVHPWQWALFIGLIAVLLIADLLLVHRTAHEIKFKEAAIACIQNQGGSTSLLQRKLGIGYGRAARIMDQLEEAGILGPANGSKPRDVRIGIDQIDEYCR